MTTGGKFADAVERLNQIMLSITLLSVETRQEVTEVCGFTKHSLYYSLSIRAFQILIFRFNLQNIIKGALFTFFSVQAQQLLGICREYLVGLTMELKRKESPKV